MSGMGAIVIGGFVMVIGLIVHYIRQDNETLKQREAWRKAEKWNWD